MKIQAAIFDLDGTLADTIEAIRDAINLTMVHYGYPTHTYEEIREYIGNGAKNLVLRSMPTAAAQDRAQHERVFLTYQDNYDRGHLATNRCYDGIPELIAALHASGVRLAVLSNKQDAFVKEIISRLFGDDLFTAVMGQSSFPPKPDPTSSLYVAKMMGVRPEQCLYIGDSDVDVETSFRAGMSFIGVGWGYRDEDTLKKAGAPVVAPNIRALMGAIVSLSIENEE